MSKYIPALFLTFRDVASLKLTKKSRRTDSANIIKGNALRWASGLDGKLAGEHRVPTLK